MLWILFYEFVCIAFFLLAVLYLLVNLLAHYSLDPLLTNMDDELLFCFVSIGSTHRFPCWIRLLSYNRTFSFLFSFSSTQMHTLLFFLYTHRLYSDLWRGFGQWSITQLRIPYRLSSHSGTPFKPLHTLFLLHYTIPQQCSHFNIYFYEIPWLGLWSGGSSGPFRLISGIFTQWA